MKPVPPMVKGSKPLLGHIPAFKNDRKALFEQGLMEHGRVFAMKLGPQNAAVLIGPEYTQLFFHETDKKLSMNKSYRFLKAMFGEILFTANPKVYQKQRPVLHAAFKREKMVSYVRVMQE